MKFGCRPYADKIGILLAQLGTPDAPTKEALIPYLRQFLWDKRIIEKQRVRWWFILNGIVLRTRPKRSALAYSRIWSDQGSPLRLHTEKQTQLLREKLSRSGLPFEVTFGMRYGKPSLESAIDELIEKGCSRILLFPLYPQYSATTSASTYDVVFPHLLKRRFVPTLRVVEPYYRNPEYLAAQAAVINEGIQAMPQKPERLVFSYHGIPEEYVDKGDPYCCMCTETTERLLPMLRIDPELVVHTYQSRFGKDPWLVPYTDQTFEKLAKSGVKRIAVACPGFTADCLETLDELGIEGSHQFQEKGGESLTLFPCLNEHPRWIEAMANIVRAECSSWLERVDQCEGLCCPVRLAKESAEG